MKGIGYWGFYISFLQLSVNLQLSQNKKLKQNHTFSILLFLRGRKLGTAYLSSTAQYLTRLRSIGQDCGLFKVQLEQDVLSLVHSVLDNRIWFFVDCWTEGLRYLPFWPLHRAARNMVAGFLRRSKRERARKS